MTVSPGARGDETARNVPARGDGRTDTMVRIAGVDKVFGAGEGAVRALDAIDLEIAAGEFVSLIGPSGCGKSTLLRLIGNLTSPSSGSVTINGKPAAQARLDRDYGIVFQAPVLMDWRTVEANVRLPLELMGVARDEQRRRTAEMLGLVELSDFAERRPWQLSGGMQQRVAIARALSFNPQLLLMDEPFGALDEMTRERMNLEVMKIWLRTGTTVVFVTHSIPEAVFLSTRVVVMSPRPGRIARIVDVDLPQPRTAETRELPRYFELVTEVRETLRHHEPPSSSGVLEESDLSGGDGRLRTGDAPLAESDLERVRAEGLG